MESNYNDFEKIIDTILQLDTKCYLKMNTKLGRKDSSDYRIPYVSGFVVNTQGYAYNTNRISVKRNFDSYLSIEMSDDQSFFVQMRANVMILVLQKLELALQEWIARNYVWSIVDNIPKVIISKVNPIEIFGLQPNNKTIRLDPIVINKNGVFDKGIRLTVSTSNSYADIDLDRFMSLVYIFRTFNLYQASLGQINSLAIYQNHPQFVKDLVNMNTSPDINEYGDRVESEGIEKSIVNRQPMYKQRQQKRKSFFDKE